LHKIESGIHPYLFHSLHQYGIYVFKFFKNSQWIYVVIDDKIPCYSGSIDNPVIVFAKCNSENEFWVSLIEKAFAKLHGNYWALVGG
jgi:calpain